MSLAANSLFLAPFVIRAGVAAATVGLAAPVIGSFLVQRRLALIGDGVGHLAFAGVALGALLGVAPLWGALVVATLGALLLERLRIRGRMTSDLSLALIFYLGIGGGATILSLINRFDASAIGVLFGSVFTASWFDVVLIAGLCGLSLLITLLLFKELLAVALDEEMARASGLPVEALNVVLVTMTAFLVSAGMRTVGLLLIAALLVVPVAAGARLSHSFRGTVVRASVIGVVSALIGVGVAVAQGTIAPGGTIVLAAMALLGASMIVGRGAAARHPRRVG